MGKMKKKPEGRNYLIFFASVLLIITAIAVTAILNATKSPSSSKDVRARASVTSLLRLRAVVVSVDEAKAQASVNGLEFTGNTPPSLQSVARNTGGVWTASVDGNVNLGVLNPGSRVELQVNPASFDIAGRSLTAASITVLR